MGHSPIKGCGRAKTSENIGKQGVGLSPETCEIDQSDKLLQDDKEERAVICEIVKRNAGADTQRQHESDLVCHGCPGAANATS